MLEEQQRQIPVKWKFVLAKFVRISKQDSLLLHEAWTCLNGCHIRVRHGYTSDTSDMPHGVSVSKLSNFLKLADLVSVSVFVCISASVDRQTDTDNLKMMQMLLIYKCNRSSHGRGRTKYIHRKNEIRFMLDECWQSLCDKTRAFGLCCNGAFVV